MQNYYFNTQGYFTYSGYANPDNLPPWNATRTVPEQREGYHPKWNGEKWGYVRDMRGTKCYMPDGSEHEISEIEGQVPESASLTKPEPTLEDIRAEKEAALAAEKRRVKDGGFMVDRVLFDSDAAARTAYLEFNALLAIDPAYSEEWKANGDTWVTLDATLFAKIVEASKQHTSSVFAWLKQQQTALKAAMTVEEIEAVSINFHG